MAAATFLAVVVATADPASAGGLPVIGCEPAVVETYLNRLGVDYFLYTSGPPQYADEVWYEEADDGDFVWYVDFVPGEPEGCPLVAVPNLVGRPLADAVAELDQLGLYYYADRDDGLVADQDPPPGALAGIGYDEVFLELTAFPPPTVATTTPPVTTPGHSPGPRPPATTGTGPTSTGHGGPPVPSTVTTVDPTDRPGHPRPSLVPTTPNEQPGAPLNTTPVAHRSTRGAWVRLLIAAALGGLLTLALIRVAKGRTRGRIDQEDAAVRVLLRRPPAVHRLTPLPWAGDAVGSIGIRVVRAPALVTIRSTAHPTGSRR
jgi:hypothetical protein